MQINAMVIPGIISYGEDTSVNTGKEKLVGILRISETVCQYYGIKSHSLMQSTRHRPRPECRYIVMLLTYVMDEKETFENLSSYYSLDHSTLSAGINQTLHNLYHTDKNFRNRLMNIMNDLNMNNIQKSSVAEILNNKMSIRTKRRVG